MDRPISRVFKVVPFGIHSGPKICKDLFRPLIVKWRSEGIGTVLYFDDGAIGGVDFISCKKAATTVFKDLALCHVLPSAEKSNWEPVKGAVWLGYFWDFEKQIVQVSPKRVDTFFERLQKLKDSFPKVTARKVALVVGSLVSMILVLEQKVLLYSRYMQSVINFREWEGLSWDSVINIDHLDIANQVRNEVQFLLDFISGILQ